MNLRTALFLLFSTAVVSINANAHERSESYSHWYLTDTGISATVTIPLREVMLLYQQNESSVAPGQLFRNHLATNTKVFSGHTKCEQSNANILQGASGFVRVELEFGCAPGRPTTVQYRALFDVAPGHVHYANLQRGNVALGDALLTDSSDSWQIDGMAGKIGSHSFSTFLAIGIRHIGTGLDHVAFLIGLLLISVTLRRSIIAVTGFTFGHSISLAAAVLGYVQADSRLVEAFIGFTIALVAIEYFLIRRMNVTGIALAVLIMALSIGLGAALYDLISTRAAIAYLGFGIFAACYLLASRATTQTVDTRPTVLLFTAATAFGLVHGFGFAGFLMETGILGRSLLVPLLGFNVGVEIGQLAIVAIVVFLATRLRRQLPRVTPDLVAAGLCGMGLFWFVSRTLT